MPLALVSRYFVAMYLCKLHLLCVSTVYKWSLAGDITYIIHNLPFVRWGLLSLVCFDLLGFFSIQYIRTKYYNLFIITHVMGLFVALFSVGDPYLSPSS